MRSRRRSEPLAKTKTIDQDSLDYNGFCVNWDDTPRRQIEDSITDFQRGYGCDDELVRYQHSTGHELAPLAFLLDDNIVYRSIRTSIQQLLSRIGLFLSSF